MKILNYSNMLIFCLLGPVISVPQQKWFTTAKHNSYYIEQEYKFTWFEAFLECSLKNMALATLDSVDKYEDIAEIFHQHEFKFHAPHLWIGAVGQNRQFSWIANSRALFTNKWIPNNPDNFQNDECCIHFWENTTGLNDRACTLKYGYICEKSMMNINSNNDMHKYRNIFININN